MAPRQLSGVKAIDGIVAGLSKLPALRDGVKAQALSPLDALGAYSQGLAAEARLFLLQSESVVVTDQLSQAIGLIAEVQAQEQLSQENALLAGMLAGKKMTPKDRAAFTAMAATRQADSQYADYILSPANLATYNAALAGTGGTRQVLTSIEQAIAAGTPVTKLPVTQAQWQALAGTLLQRGFNGGVAIADAILVRDHQISHAAWVKVAVTSGIALLGLLATILVTTLVARGVIRRLGGLERNALQLAEVQLPDVVGRLRRGENVDVDTEAPALQVGRDEIGRVGQAFDLVRQTAVRAAVEEARLRQGLNDVFRSLARRSQSLLHRQLTLLDQMERRASDPEALDDLFRLDHLTTRMRRHAEGLVILAGAPTGRGWSSPVRMVDVMRGAIAEVEDYARVSVATRSQAALAGSAVADVIHLLAELIENATTLSPPYTSVRVSGDTVANGFAIEVEDRGLGMSPPRLAELNDRLARPPEFNPSDSEQLGLFVVSQLAKRHGIRVTLKASPYGGTTAILLIPRHLVVTEDAFRARLPGEPGSAATAQLTTNGNHAVPVTPAELAGQGESGFSPLGSGPPGLAQTPGVRISGALRRSQGISPERMERGAHAAPISAPAPALAPAHGPAGTGPDGLPRRHHDQPVPGEAGLPAGAGPMPFGSAPSDFDVFTPRGHVRGAGETPGAADAGPGSGPAPATEPSAPFSGSGSYVASPPYPASGSSPYPDQPAPFPGWTLHNPPAASGGRTAPRPGTPAGPTTPMTPVASSRPGQASGPPWELPGEARPLPAGPGGSGPGPDMAGPDDSPGASAPGQAGQPGAPASRQPAAAPDHGGQRRPVQRVERSESGGDQANHVGTSARLAGGPLAADGRPGIRRASTCAISR